MAEHSLGLSPDPPDLAQEVDRLKKIITVLMDRAERSTSAHGSDFNRFQATIMLEQQVRRRTAELEAALRENAQITNALLEARQRFERAFEHAPIGMALVGLDGSWLKVNRAMCAITGHSEPELLTMSFRDITHVDDLEQSLDGLRSLQSGQIYQAEKRYLHADGHVIWVQLACSVVCDEHGSPLHFVAQTQDITEPKMLRERLQQAQRLETVGALAGGVAHDFNNLLAVILNYVGLLRDQLPAGGQELDDLEQIARAATRGARLTQKLLAFGQRTVGELQIVDIGEVIAGMLTMLDRPLGDRVELRYEPTADLWPVRADPTAIEQIILNLVLNARDALMGRGGLIIGSVQNVELSEQLAATLGMQRGCYVRLSVTDSGCGMDPDTLKHVFEPYFTTKPAAQGSGLGLATVYGIARQAGGGIAITSNPGSGTTIEVHLPAASGRAVAGGTAHWLPPEGIDARRILLVETEAPTRDAIRGVLEHAGYEVCCVESAEQALTLLAAENRGYELLVTAVVMPGMWGDQLAVGAQPGLQLPTLYMSGHRDRFLYGSRTPVFGATLTKPFSEDELLLEVAKLLGAHEGSSAQPLGTAADLFG